MSKRYMALLVAVCGVSACSSAPPPSSSAAATIPQAPVVPVSSVSPVGSLGMAKACSIQGLHWRREVQIEPTMALSNDGYCGTTISVSSNTTAIMQVSSQPHHGRLDTFGADSTLPGFRYYPDAGYVGQDSFVMLTGRAGHEVYANFAVSVSQ